MLGRTNAEKDSYYDQPLGAWDDDILGRIKAMVQGRRRTFALEPLLNRTMAFIVHQAPV